MKNPYKTVGYGMAQLLQIIKWTKLSYHANCRQCITLLVGEKYETS